jgi:hypothetical protein
MVSSRDKRAERELFGGKREVTESEKEAARHGDK